MRRKVVLAGLVGSAVIFACKPRQEGAGSEILTNATNPNELAVDVNDLSYLLPRNAAGQVYPEIRVQQGWAEARAAGKLMPLEGASTQILSKVVYDSIVAATADQTNFGQKANSLKTPFTAGDVSEFEHEAFVITSFRIDPCAPSLALDKARTNYQNPVSQSVIAGLVQQINQEISDIFAANKFTLSACQTQLRLILQPLSPDKKTIRESTIHMVYTLNSGAGVMNDTLQADVQGLKKKLQDVTGVDTTGYMLQPHPGLATEGAGNQDSTKYGPGASAVVDYLSSILHKYNNPQVMAVIREKVIRGVQYDVVLGGGVADPRETATYTAGPLVGSAARKGFIITSDANRRNWRMDPQPTRNSPVFDNLITFDAERIDSPQESTLLNMMKKDDPESTHFFVNDCVTCHGTSQAFHEITDPTIAASTAPRYRVPPGVSGFPIGTFLPPAPGGAGDKVVGVMLRNFGYSQGQPVIGLRTVTETAALADYFNRDLRRINNPGASCVGPAEEKAWIAAISIGKGSDGAYTFSKTSAREDALFAAAGCATKVEGNAALGTRGDGANTPKVGDQKSPIFSQMSFEGQTATGPLTLTLAKMGQAALSRQSGNNAPELTLGQWSYDADPNARVSQIKVAAEGTTLILAMNGYSLCEVLPNAEAKPTLSGCLSIQNAWVKAAKSGTGPVGLYNSNDCKGDPVLRINASSTCDGFASTQGIIAVKVDGGPCELILQGTVPTGDKFCERFKAGGSASFTKLYKSDSCSNGMLLAFVTPTTDCRTLGTSTGINRLEVWGYRRNKGSCEDDSSDPAFETGCNRHK